MKRLATGSLALLLVACGDAQDKGPSDAASPNASIQPAPLQSIPDPSQSAAPPVEPTASSDSHVSGPPEAFVAEHELEADPLPLHETPGVELQVAFKWRDVPNPPKAPEVNLDGIAKAQKLTALTWQVDLAEAGRMRILFSSRALPLPTFSEVRAKSERFGNVIVWPNLVKYRVAPPGALRTVIGERRVDVTPLSTAAPKPQGEGKKLGVMTRKLELVSPIGSLKLEIGKVPEAGDGGPLFCRALVEIAGIDPRSNACQPGEVPLSAVYTWSDGGGISLEASNLIKKTDLDAATLLVPPAQARFTPSGLPPVGDGIFLSREELAAFRTVPLPLPPGHDPSVPGEGFIAANHTDMLSYILVDGVPVAGVPAEKEKYVIGPLRGRYVIQWRTFLGEKIERAQPVEFPARLIFGGPHELLDAGTPDASK